MGVLAPLLQFLPLLVFIVVDALVDDVRLSIAVAIGFAVVQLGVTWARARRFDWFVVLDAALIAGLGGVSIALEDELFFKLKPAVIDVVTLGLLVALLFSSDAFLAGYVGRLMPGREVPPPALALMRTLAKWMCGALVVHVVAVLWAAFYASKGVWAFVAGPGAWLVLAPVLVPVLRARRARR